MISILLFRTDRIGDFLLSLLLIKNIKRKYTNSKITVVTSYKNYDYVKTFSIIDEIILLKNDIYSKTKLIFSLRKQFYDTVIVHDGKNRSKLISFFLKYKEKIVCSPSLKYTQIEKIKDICLKLKIDYNDDCLNFLENRNHKYRNLPYDNFILLHFDEKWLNNKYISKYVKIEPSEDELLNFIENLTKTNNLIITTGKESNNLIKFLKGVLKNKKVTIFEDQSLLEIENIVFKSKLIITCHGWISHIASAKNIKTIDIIDKIYPYDKWTSHFRNYNFLYRENFIKLSDKIIELI